MHQPRLRAPPDAAAGGWLPSGDGRATRLAALALVLLAGPLYIEGLTRWPLWEDEDWTRLAVAGTPLEMVHFVAGDRHPPLFFIGEWIFGRASSGDGALRAFPALCGLAMALLVHRLTRRFLGGPAAWAAGILAALLPFTVAAAATARAGTLMALLGAGLLGASLSLAGGRKPRRAALAIAVLGAAGLYTHYTMGWALAGAASGAFGGILRAPDLSRAQKRERLVLLGLALAAATVAFSPWALGPMWRQWAAMPNNDSSLPRDFRVLRYLLWPVGQRLVTWASYPLLLVAIVGAVGLARRSPIGGVIAGWGAAAIVVPWAFSNNAFAAGRYYLFAGFFPYFCVCAAWGLASLAAVTARGRLQRARSILPGAVALAACTPGLLLLLRTPGSPVAIGPIPAGIYDPRFEADLLASIRAGGQPPIFAPEPSLWAWRHYRPELMGSGAGQSWIAANRSPEGGGGEQAGRKSRCVFRDAFSLVVEVRDPAGCEALLAAIVANADRYGPFQLEVAGRLSDPAEVIVRAEAAGAAMPCSLAPEELSAIASTYQGDTARAVATLESAAWKAAQVSPAQLAGLLTKARRLAESAGQRDEARRLSTMEDCAIDRERAITLPLCLTPLAALLSAGETVAPNRDGWSPT